MFDVSKITTALAGLVGFDNPTNPTYAIVDATNRTASSGRKYTDNPFIKIEYLKDNYDYSSVSDANFNTFLTSINKRAIVNVIDKIFNESDFIDRQMLYQFPNNKSNGNETLPSGFVGYKISQCVEKDLCIEITRCLCEFSGTGTITLLLFNTAKSTPVHSQAVTINSTLVEQTLNWKLDNTTSFYKGDYYFGYLTSGLSVTPIKRDYNNSNLKSIITFIDIENIKVNGVTSQVLWNIENDNGVSECWGLNPDISIYKDFTNTIIQNPKLFARAIQLEGQINCLSTYLSSLRTNQNERFSKELINKIIIEIEGADIDDGLKKVGLKKELSGEITRIKNEIKRIADGFFTRGIEVITLT